MQREVREADVRVCLATDPKKVLHLRKQLEDAACLTPFLLTKPALSLTRILIQHETLTYHQRHSYSSYAVQKDPLFPLTQRHKQYSMPLTARMSL